MFKKVTYPRGSLIEVHWVDVVGTEHGAPPEGTIWYYITPGYFYDWRTTPLGDTYLITARSIGNNEPGWDAYPLGIIKQITLVRRDAK